MAYNTNTDILLDEISKALNTARTPCIVAATTDSNLQAVYAACLVKSFTIENVGLAAGTVSFSTTGPVSLAAGKKIEFPNLGAGIPASSISFAATGTTLLISFTH